MYFHPSTLLKVYLGDYFAGPGSKSGRQLWRVGLEKLKESFWTPKKEVVLVWISCLRFCFLPLSFDPLDPTTDV